MQWPFQEQAGRDRAEPRRWHLRPSVAGEAFLFTSENDSGRSSVACPIFTAPYWPLRAGIAPLKVCLLGTYPHLKKDFSNGLLADTSVSSCTMSKLRALPLQHTRQHPNSLYSHADSPTPSREAFPLSFGFWFPKVCHDQQILQASLPRHLPSPSSTLPPTPALLVHMQRKEASPLWQQQNTTLQKRCAPLTVTIKKGVDRIRAGDDDLRGRDVQKDARRKEKGLSFLCLSFFISFFFFSQDSSSPTWHMSDWGGVNLPRG